LSAIIAAVVGVILNLAAWFALHTWFREARPVRALSLSFDVLVSASLDLMAGPLKPGTYTFFDDDHPDMAKGTVVVTEQQAEK